MARRATLAGLEGHIRMFALVWSSRSTAGRFVHPGPGRTGWPFPVTDRRKMKTRLSTVQLSRGEGPMSSNRFAALDDAGNIGSASECWQGHPSLCAHPKNECCLCCKCSCLRCSFRCRGQLATCHFPQIGPLKAGWIQRAGSGVRAAIALRPSRWSGGRRDTWRRGSLFQQAGRCRRGSLR